jgi:hypothetical protein
LLEAYQKNEVVALSFDQHIPEPDPLTNPDSVDRAKEYELYGTPTFVFDGGKPKAGGGGRTEAEKLYKKFASAADALVDEPTGVGLQLTASRGAGGQVEAHANVTVGDAQAIKADAQAIKAKLDAKAKADADAAAKDAPKKKKLAKAPAPTATAKAADADAAPKLVVNFALVEDGIRYSGENGVRFHRMVVRALAKPADSGFPVEMSKTATVDATFDPAAISAKLSEYLTQYEKSNDRFGPIKFISKDTAMQPDHLAIAAWVQDTATHRVLQSAIVPLGEK